MYWLRSFAPLDLALLGLLTLVWALGGWLLASTAFRLRRAERLVAGAAIGFLLFITLSNLLANLLPLTPAFWLGGLAVLGLGAWAALAGGERPWLDFADLRRWRLPAAFLLLAWLFSMAQRGVAIFDEYLHIPLISIMATGDIPPHFYLDPAVRFTYHYGLHVWSASLVRMGQLTPWSAFDLARGITLAFSACLAWLWLLRWTRSRAAAWLGSLALLFAGGARWLLLFLPPDWLAYIGSQVTPSNATAVVTPTFLEALTQPWLVEGSGATPFPFAYHSGIFAPAFFVLGSTGAMSFMTVLLLVLLYRRGRLSLPGGVTLILLLASLALSAEHLFATFGLGAGLALLAGAWRRRGSGLLAALREQSAWWGALIASAALSLVQGAFLTEVARTLISRLLGEPSGQVNYHGFSLRWPPGLTSAHLGDYTLFNPSQLFVLLLELGPVLLLAPLATAYAVRRLRRGDWMTAGLGLAAWINLVFPLLVRYGVDRSTTRMPATALWLWLLLALPPLWQALKAPRPRLRQAVGIGYGAAIAGGLVIFAIQMTSIPAPQFTYFIDVLDANLARQYWDRLPPGTQVLDPNPSRGATVFGRASRVGPGIYELYPEWEALIASADPAAAAGAGYDYILVDHVWWRRLRPAQQAALQGPCVQRVAGQVGDGENFRWLLDIRACR